MADKDQKAAPPVVTPFVSGNAQGNHKNAAISPTSGKPLPEWRRTRDYEQFEPTPNK